MRVETDAQRQARNERFEAIYPTAWPCFPGTDIPVSNMPYSMWRSLQRHPFTCVNMLTATYDTT